jgi:hypothetical protein
LFRLGCDLATGLAVDLEHARYDQLRTQAAIAQDEPQRFE